MPPFEYVTSNISAVPFNCLRPPQIDPEFSTADVGLYQSKGPLIFRYQNVMY